MPTERDLKLKIIQIVTTLFIGLFLCACNTYAGDAATQLNQDWKNINRTGCKSGDPDYYCSGVIVHVFDNESFLHTSNSYPWMPNDKGIGRGSISFSYLRQDIPVEFPLFPADIAAGYIFAPIARLSNSKQYTLFCDYPQNGATDWRPDNKGCGPYHSNSTDLSTCKSAGINTSDDYVKNVEQYHQECCSASPDQNGFTMVLDTIKKLTAAKYYPSWNELVIQEWSNKESKDVPIEAFFYEIVNNTPDIKGKAAADSAAQLYQQVTGIEVPVIAVDVEKLTAGSDAPFSNETQ